MLQDIAGYTTFSEKLRQEGKAGIEKLTSILNAFFTEQEEKVRAHKGFVFKLAGDAYFAALPPYNTEEVLKNLLHSAVLERYGLKSRVVGVLGDYSLNILRTSYGRDVVPTGALVRELMTLEENTEGGAWASLILRKNHNNFNPPAWFYSKRKHKRELITYRPQVTGFLKLESGNIGLVEEVLRFIKKQLSYVYVSKIVPYSHGFMIVLFYGYPLATGKEKDLAIISSLSLKDYLENNKSHFGIGLSYDYVYTGVVGGKYFKELTFIGDGINIAARLATLAKNQVFATFDIIAGLKELYEFEERGEVKVKGKKEAVKVYNILKRKYLPSSALFIDREIEQKKLKSLISAGERVFLVAEAGVGKTVLITRVLQDSGFKFVFIRGFPGQPPMDGIISIIKSLPARIKQKYPLLLNLEEGKKIESEAIYLFLHKLLQRALSEDAVQLVCVDDMHWLDALSESVLKNLATSGYLITGTIREEYFKDMDTSWFTAFPLSPFDRDITGEYIKALLGKDVDKSFVDTVFGSTRGVPFLIEQLVVYLRERGLIEEKNGVYSIKKTGLDEVPKDAFSLLIARYDMLGIAEKVFVGYASLVGTEFKAEDILSVMPKRLRNVNIARLVNVGFIVSQGEGVYTFRHALLREVIYVGILGTKRRFMHKRLARLFAQKGYPPYVVAEQYEKGGAWRKADEYWIESFFYFLDRGFHSEAAKVKNRVKDSLGKKYLEASLLEHYGKYDEAERIILRLIPRARGRKRVKLLLRLSSIYDFWGRYDRMGMVLERLKSYEKYMDEDEKYMYLEELGIYYDMTGKKEKALELYQESLKYAKDGDRKAIGLFNIGWIYYSTSKYKEAEKYFIEALKPDSTKLTKAWIFLRLGGIKLLEEKDEEAKLYLEQSFKNFFESGFTYGINLVIPSLLALYMKMNEYEEVRRVFEELKETTFLVEGMLAFYIAFKFFNDKQNMKWILENTNEKNRFLISMTELLLDGKLEEAYRECKRTKFPPDFCKIVEKVYKRNITNKDMPIYHAFALLYCKGEECKVSYEILKKYKKLDALSFFIWERFVASGKKGKDISY